MHVRESAFVDLIACKFIPSQPPTLKMVAWCASVHPVRSYFSGVVAEIQWAERLS